MDALRFFLKLPLGNLSLRVHKIIRKWCESRVFLLNLLLHLGKSHIKRRLLSVLRSRSIGGVSRRFDELISIGGVERGLEWFVGGRIVVGVSL